VATPAQVLAALKRGNDRHRTKARLIRSQIALGPATANEQHPAAVVLGCIDSRVPAEVVFGLGIGDAFIARVAGNIVDKNMLGSLEFACAIAGARVIVVLGHTGCGAIMGAIDDVELGNLTDLLARIKPAIARTSFAGEHKSGNLGYVDAVARTNVRLAVGDIRQGSEILAALEKTGDIAIIGAVYDLGSGKVDFLDERAASTAAQSDLK